MRKNTDRIWFRLGSETLTEDGLEIPSVPGHVCLPGSGCQLSRSSPSPSAESLRGPSGLDQKFRVRRARRKRQEIC